jgi:hypothetical protein
VAEKPNRLPGNAEDLRDLRVPHIGVTQQPTDSRSALRLREFLVAAGRGTHRQEVCEDEWILTLGDVDPNRWQLGETGCFRCHHAMNTVG